MNAATALVASLGVPIIASVLVVFFGAANRHVARRIALVATVIVLALAGFVVSQFHADGDTFFDIQRDAVAAGQVRENQLDVAQTAFAVTDWSWLPPETGIDVHFSVGLDGLSIWMYGLSAVLMLTSVLVSWEAIENQSALFYAMLLLLEAGCLGVFAARDLILFYIFFEFTLIPLFFLIGIWGSEARRYAAIKFFLYTLAGSLLTFLGLLAIVLWNQQQSGSAVIQSSIPRLAWGLAAHPLPASWQYWIFLALFAGFAIKVPLFPLHTWLPLAHVQAPTAGSVFLAGILLKIGTYGFLRFNIPWLPEATLVFLPWVAGLAVAGIVYGALVALVQTDMKRLIAYSSVSHLGFCMLGLFALTPLGVQGAALQMVNHGISTGGLFAIVGMLYERYHTREMANYSGMAKRLPIMAFFLLLFTFSSIGLPGLNGFVGEFMILTGAFQRGWSDFQSHSSSWMLIVSIIAVSGVVLGAWYMLGLVQRVFFGPEHEPAHETSGHGHGAPIHDLNPREIVALLPLVVLVFWIGLYPQFFLQRMQPGLNSATRSAAEIPSRTADAPGERPLVAANR